MKKKDLDRLKGLGVKSVCYVAITPDVFDLPVPLEYSNSEFLKGKVSPGTEFSQM